MFQHTLLTDSDFGRIREAVVRTLERAGMMIQNERLLNALEQAGARADRAAERAWIPARLTEELIAEQARRAPADPAEPLRMAAPSLPGFGTQVAQFSLDWEKRERRPGNRDDFLTMIRFGDALQGGSVGHCLLMTDVPPMVEPLEAVALLVEHAHKPEYTYPHHAEQFDYLAEIGEIWEGRKDRFLVGGIFITSPLRVCRRAADFIAKRLSLGMECGCGTMACVGASVPVTMAGAITVTAAEILGTWAAIRAFQPEAHLSAGVACGSVDMRSGHATFCSPEAMLLNFGTREFFRRLCGAPIGIAGADDYTDARFPGLAAAYEKAFKVMTVAAVTGAMPPIGEGMLESGKTLSPEQLLIEREMTGHLRRLAQPITVSPETIALEAIEEVGVGIGKTHLMSEHTAAHFREALWLPKLFERTVWQGFEAEARAETAVVDRAHAMFREILASYQAPACDPEKLEAIRAVIERARKHLVH